MKLEIDREDANLRDAVTLAWRILNRMGYEVRGATLKASEIRMMWLERITHDMRRGSYKEVWHKLLVNADDLKAVEADWKKNPPEMRELPPGAIQQHWPDWAKWSVIYDGACLVADPEIAPGECRLVEVPK